MGEIRVASIMTRDPEVAAREDSLGSLLERMARHHYSCLFVCEEGRPVGVVTERDVLRLLGSGMAGHLLDRRADELMTGGIASLHSDAGLGSAIELFRSRAIRHLPVVDDKGRMCGIVTQTDLLSVYVREVQVQLDRLDEVVAERTRELEESNRRLEELSLLDGLLGIGNRRSMEIHLQSLADVSCRYDQKYALILLDVDSFKAYNDRYGHLAGDEALKATARAVEGSLRTPDRTYRYGGEEILVALPETDLSGGREAAERIRGQVEALGIGHEDSPSGVLTVSGGLASSHGADGKPRSRSDWQEMVEDADRALYRAKEGGRNRIALADPD